MDEIMRNAFVDELNKIAAGGSISAKIKAAKKAPPGPDLGGGPGKGKNDPNFLENIGRGFKKKAEAKGSKITQLLKSLKKEPKGKA